MTQLATDPIAPSPKRSPDAAWRRGFDDLSAEHGFTPLRVEGRLPAELTGTLYRNGPGGYGVAGERYRHWFDGDGAVSAVRLSGGQAFGAARMVETKARERERQAGRRLFGSYDTPLSRPIREVFLGDRRNPANTSLLLWQERLFALCEAGRPFEMSPRDLASLGETDLSGQITHAFSAHPHYVPARRTTYNFGCGRGKNTPVSVYALPDEGPARRIADFTVEGARFHHDFAATERHLVFAFSPFYVSLWSLLTGKSPISGGAWRADRGTEIVVVPIDQPDRIVRFTVDSFHLEHVVNAFERDGQIVFDYIHYSELRGLEQYVGRVSSGVVQGPLASEVRRLVVDPAKRTTRSETILAQPVELPRVSPRVDAKPHRIAYYAGFSQTSQAASSIFDAIVRHDVENGAVTTYTPGAGLYPSEGVFVPRRDSSAEDDGWLLTMVFDARENRSHLQVLDARALGDGPVARCHFDHAIPFGFHGIWAA